MAGRRLTGAATRPATTVRLGRDRSATCTECGARLSTYNPGPNCFAHTLDLPWKGPGVRLR